MPTITKHVTRQLIALEASAPCSEAARLMSERTIGAIALRSAGRTIGIVTERDLAVGVVAKGLPNSTPCSEVMRRDLPLIPPESSEKECSDLMRDHRTRHLLVEENGEVIGIVSLRDVIALMLDEKQFLIEQLQVYIDGR